MSIEDLIRDLLKDVIVKLELSKDPTINIELVRTKSKEHGDIATNVALKLAGHLGIKPRDVAQSIIDNLKFDPDQIVKTEIAGPGFVAALPDVLGRQQSLGRRSWQELSQLVRA